MLSFRIPPTQLVDCHTQPTQRTWRPLPEIPPTQWWIGSYSAYKRSLAPHFPESHQRSGGSFILRLQRSLAPLPGIPPTQLVDCSYSPTKEPGAHFPESHQRSWWIVHTQPTKEPGAHFPESHQRSGGLFILSLQRSLAPTSRNPTNAVGGLFILSLQRSLAPTSRIPPTQLVDCSYSATKEPGAHSGIPPTQLVDCSYSPKFNEVASALRLSTMTNYVMGITNN